MQLVTRLALCMSEEYAEDAAAVLDEANNEEVTAVLAALEPAVAARMIAHLAPARARAALRSLEQPRRTEVLRAIEPQAAARALRAEPLESRSRLLAELPPARRRRIEKLLLYGEDSVGASLDPDAAAWPEDWSAGQALESLRQRECPVAEEGYTLDRGGRLVGVVTLASILTEPAASPLSALARSEFSLLRAETSLAVALAHAGWSSSSTLPVVGGDGQFMGALHLRRLHRLMLARQQGDSTSALDERTAGALGELAAVAWKGALSAVASGGRGSERGPDERGGA